MGLFLQLGHHFGAQLAVGLAHPAVAAAGAVAAADVKPALGRATGQSEERHVANANDHWVVPNLAGDGMRLQYD